VINTNRKIKQFVKIGDFIISYITTNKSDIPAEDFIGLYN